MTERALLSPAAAARYIEAEWHLRVSTETVRRWVRKGALPATESAGGRIAIDPADLHAIFDARQTESERND